MLAEPVYYFRPGGSRRDIAIPLQVEPTELVVEAASGEVAREALAARELGVASSRRIAYAGQDHHRIRLASGTSRSAVEDAVRALRHDPSINFIGHAYTTAQGDTLTLVNRLVVRFHRGAAAADIHRFVDSVGLGVLWQGAPESGRSIWWLTYPRDRDPLTVAARVHSHPLVQWAEPDRLGRSRPTSHVPSDGFYADQYYLNNTESLGGVAVDVNVEDAWLVTKGSSGIRVAVIGSGIDGDHPELSSRRTSDACGDGWDEAFEEPDYTGSAWDPEVQDCTDPLGCSSPLYPHHETAVAGIIAAQHNGTGTVGIAPNVKLLSARTNPGVPAAATPAQRADAIDWASNTCGADVVNGSYEDADGPSTAIADAIADGARNGRGGRGTVFVFAGGNGSNRAGGTVVPVAYPAAYEDAIAVGAIDRYGLSARHVLPPTV